MEYQLNLTEAVDAINNDDSLTDLCIGDNINDADIEELTTVLGKLHLLTNLDLSYNRIGWKGASLLADTFQCNESITRLNLSHNNIGDAGVGAISGFLQSKSNLTELNISANNIGVVGAARLNAALANVNEGDSMLKYIHLNENEIGNDGALALSPFIRNHSELLYLGLRANDIHDHGLSSLIDAAIANPFSVSQLDLSENNASDKTSSSIIEAQKWKPMLTINVSLDEDYFNHSSNSATDNFMFDDDDIDDDDDSDFIFGSNPSLNGEISDDDNFDDNYENDAHLTWGYMADELVEILKNTIESIETEEDVISSEIGEPTVINTVHNISIQVVTFHETPSSIASKINGVLHILSHNIRPTMGTTYNEDGTINEEVEPHMPPILLSLYSDLPLFERILLDAPNLIDSENATKLGPVFENTTGQISPRCGIIRVKICELISSLIKLQYTSIDTSLVEVGIIRSCVALLFQYHWNNMLHSAVQNIIRSIVEGPSLDLKIELLQGCSLGELLIDAHFGNERDISLPKGRRRGYMGHVYSLSSLLSSAATEDGAIESLLCTVPGWRSYVDNVVNEAIASHQTPIGGGPTQSSPASPAMYLPDSSNVMWTHLASIIQGMNSYDIEDDDDSKAREVLDMTNTSSVAEVHETEDDIGLLHNDAELSSF